jgi:hypothetical protein
MLQAFQPNKAKPIDYVSIFRNHVSSTMKRPQDWGKVEPTFQRMAQLRNNFVWDDIARSEMFNNPQMRVVQDNIEEYLRYCIFISTKFKFGKNGVKNFKSDWLMAWTGKKVKSNTMLYEIVSMLYNYTILNFNQAVIYLKKGQSKNDYKGSLEKLRYAKWAAKEMIALTDELNKVMKLPFELRADALDFLLGLTEGMSYLCFYYMFEDGSNPAVSGDNLASLEKEVARWFFLCRQSLKASKDLKKIMKGLYPEILEYYYLYNFNCLVRTIKIAGIKHDAEKTKGFIGIQYAYMLEAESLMKQMKKDDKFPGKDDLYRRWKKDVEPLMYPTKEKIRQVYKCPIPKPDQLDLIKPISTKVTPIEPKNIRVPPPDAPYFTGFFSEKVESLRSSIQLFISNKKQHIQKTYFDLTEKMREIYANNNIETLVHCANLNGLVMTEEFKTNLKVFKEMNGGASSYHTINQNLTKYSQQIEKLFGDIDKLVVNEQANDKQVASTTGNANAITPFVSANQAELS